ncbi:hypothetical protein [Leucobacter sp. GX24907]
MTDFKLFPVYVSPFGPREHVFMISPGATHIRVILGYGPSPQEVDLIDENKKLRGDLNEARSERDWWRDEARNAAMRPDVAPSFERNPRNLRGEQLLDLIDTIKETGGTVEIHGVKIQRIDERGQTY